MRTDLSEFHGTPTQVLLTRMFQVLCDRIGLGNVLYWSIPHHQQVGVVASSGEVDVAEIEAQQRDNVDYITLNVLARRFGNNNKIKGLNCRVVMSVNKETADITIVTFEEK